MGIIAALVHSLSTRDAAVRGAGTGYSKRGRGDRSNDEILLVALPKIWETCRWNLEVARGRGAPTSTVPADVLGMRVKHRLMSPKCL